MQFGHFQSFPHCCFTSIQFWIVVCAQDNLASSELFHTLPFRSFDEGESSVSHVDEIEAANCANDDVGAAECSSMGSVAGVIDLTDLHALLGEGAVGNAGEHDDIMFVFHGNGV